MLQKGLTALLAAASAGHTAIVNLLLERGANVDAVDHVRTFLPSFLRPSVHYNCFFSSFMFCTVGFEFFVHGM